MTMIPNEELSNDKRFGGRRLCEAVTGSGSRCSRRAVAGHGLRNYCKQHHPTLDRKKWNGPGTKKAMILREFAELPWLPTMQGQMKMITYDTLKAWGLDPNYEGGDIGYIQKVMKAEGYRSGTSMHTLYIYKAPSQP